MNGRVFIALFVVMVLSALAIGAVQPALAETGGPPGHPLYLPVVVRGASGPVPSPTPTAPPPVTPTPPPGPTPVPPRPWSAYGLRAPVNATSLPGLANSGTTWLRPSQSVRWAEVEPVEGQRNWSALAGLEAELQAAYEKGFWTVVTIQDTPAWAQLLPGKPCGPVKPTELAAFSRFLSDLVARYSRPPYGVRYWMLWDEIDVPRNESLAAAPGCWGDPSVSGYGGGEYAALLKAAYPSIRAADPAAQIVLGGLTLDCRDCPAATFLDGVLLEGSGPYFDTLAFYAYDELAPFDFDWGSTFQYANPAWGTDWFTSGPVLLAKLDFLSEKLSKFNAGGKGYFSAGSGLVCEGCDYLDPIYRQAKADYLAGLYAAGVALDGIVWDDLSSLAGDDLVPQAPQDLPYFAYQFSRLDGPGGAGEYLGPVQPGDVGGLTELRGYRYARPGAEVWVVWLASPKAEHRDVTFNQAPIAAFDVHGNPLPLTPAVTVGPAPVYVEFVK